MLLQTESLYQRLTPAHISLAAWSYNDSKCITFSKLEEKKSTGSKGIHCVAKQPLKQGELLLTEEPFIQQLDARYKLHRCHQCFRQLTKTNGYKCRVRDCRWKLNYCSIECERKGWSQSHQWFCPFPELEGEDPDVLFALEGYIASRAKGQDTLPGLISNVEAVNTSQRQSYRQKFDSIATLFYLSNYTLDCLVTILLQIKCNAFAIKSATNRSVGSDLVVSRDFITTGRAVYQLASRLNHDCNPNALVSFGESEQRPCQIRVQCVNGPIASGQEVTISYGPLATAHSRDERKKKLKESYFFDCECSACSSQDSNSPDSIYKCQICKTGRLYRQQSKCNHCEQPPYWAHFLKVESEIELNYLRGDYFKILQLQESIYHNDTLPVGQTLDKLAQHYCVQGQMAMAAKFSKRSLEVTQKVYGKISIEAAEEMMKLSTLLLNSMQKQEALKQINATMVLYKILGLDKTAPEDMEELQDMKAHLMFIMR